MGSFRTLDKTVENAAKKGPAHLSGLLSLGRPLVMGILNVTPDSFSDGGQFLDPAAAIAHAAEMIQQGADILDIGAESTRPYGGAIPVSADDEKARIVEMGVEWELAYRGAIVVLVDGEKSRLAPVLP